MFSFQIVMAAKQRFWNKNKI